MAEYRRRKRGEQIMSDDHARAASDAPLSCSVCGAEATIPDPDRPATAKAWLCPRCTADLDLPGGPALLAERKRKRIESI